MVCKDKEPLEFVFNFELETGYSLSDISIWRLAAPRAENKSSLTLVSAERFFSSVEFLSCIAARAFISSSGSGWEDSRFRSLASSMRY